MLQEATWTERLAGAIGEASRQRKAQKLVHSSRDKAHAVQTPFAVMGGDVGIGSCFGQGRLETLIKTSSRAGSYIGPSV